MEEESHDLFNQLNYSEVYDQEESNVVGVSRNYYPKN